MPPRRAKANSPAKGQTDPHGATSRRPPQRSQPLDKASKKFGGTQQTATDAKPASEPADADSAMPPESATFGELLQHLQGVVVKLQDWGQREGFGPAGPCLSETASATKVVVQNMDFDEAWANDTASMTKVDSQIAGSYRPWTDEVLAVEDIKPVVDHANIDGEATLQSAPEPAPEAAPESEANSVCRQTCSASLPATLDKIIASPMSKEIAMEPLQEGGTDFKLCEVWAGTSEALDPALELAQAEDISIPIVARRRSSRSFLGFFGGHEMESVSRSRLLERSPSNLQEVSHCARNLILTPYSRRRATWEWIGALLLLWDMFFIPFQSFETQAQPFDNMLVRVLEMSSLIYWTADVLASLCVGFYRQDGMIEMRPLPIAKSYLMSWFLFDMVCVVTDYVLHFSDGMRVRVRLLRLVRIVKLRKRLRNTMMMIRSNKLLIILRIAKNMAIVLILNHIIACGWHHVGSHYPFSENSWVTRWLFIDTNQHELRSLSYRYTTSLHWAITQLGVGAVEIVPTNSAERLYAVIVGIIALITSSVLFSSVTTSMLQLQELTQKEQSQDQAMRQFLRKSDISQKLQGLIWAFLKKSRKQDKDLGIIESDVEAIMLLPSHMVLTLRLEVYVPTIIHHPFFGQQFAEIRVGGARGKTTRDLLGIMQGVLVKQEEDLFRTGDKATKMQFVAAGEVKYISRFDDCSEGAILEPGDWLAEQALWLRWEHVGRAVAVEVSEMFVLDAKRFQKIMVNDRSARVYALLFIQQLHATTGPVSDVIGRKEQAQPWQYEISSRAFRLRNKLAHARTQDLSRFPENAPWDSAVL